MNDLPVSKILVAAVALPWALRGPLSIALALPTLGFLLLDLGGVYFGNWTPFVAVSYIGHLILFAAFAVNCHRLFLLGAGVAPYRIALHWSRREARFVGMLIALWVSALLFEIVALMATVPALGLVSGQLLKIDRYAWLVGYAADLYVWARFALILPAVSIDKAVNFTWAWNLSRGNVARLIFLLGIVPWILRVQPVKVESAVAVAVESLLRSALLVVQIAILSLSYRHLISNGPHTRVASAD